METEADVAAAFVRFKELADRKSEIFDEDILTLVGDKSATAATDRATASCPCRSTVGEPAPTR